MGKASSSKKVARAAKAGGGPSRRQGRQTSWSFYGTLAGISVVGIALLAVSLNSTKSENVPPTLQDHWHAAYGIYVCNQYVEPINGEGLPDVTGIHAHADGLIHIHPFTSAVTGKKATLGKFEESVNFKLTEKEMKLPDKRGDYKNGDTCTVGDKKKKATVKVFTYTERVGDGSSAKKLDKGLVVLGDPRDIRLYQGQILSFAFVPDGVVPPVPPSETALESPSDLVAATTTVVGATTTTAAGAAGGSATTVAGATTTVAAGAAGATTTAPASATTTTPTTTPTTSATTTAPTATTGPTTTAG